MRIIELNAAPWRNVWDLDDALKEALGSCEGHGSSVDAWIDSMIYGGMNAVEPPYVIRVVGTASVGAKLQDAIWELAEAIREARAWRLEHYGDDVDVSFQIEP